MAPSPNGPVAAGLQAAVDGSIRSLFTRLRKIKFREWLLCGTTAAAMAVMGRSSLFSASPGLISQPFYAETLGWSENLFIAAVLSAIVYGVYHKLGTNRLSHQLTEAERLFYVLGESGSDLIAIVDTEGHRIYNSPSYEKILGYTQDDLKNSSGLDQIHPDDRQRVVAAAKEAEQTGEGRLLEYRIRHHDGSWRMFESTCSAVRDHRGRVDKLVIVNRDVTAQREQAREILRQKEEQLRQAQKMEAVGRLSGGIAHDFNNLLSVIIGYAEDLEHNLDPSNHLHREAEEVRKAGERASSLTRQLLAFSRQHAIQPQILDVNSVIDNLAQMLRRLIGSDIDLAVELDPLLGRIKADQGQIEQVIMNLVVNARDAMPDGGRLSVCGGNIDLSPSDAAGIPGAAPGPYIELTVADTGIGMDANTLAHIFEPFFTTKGEGKGTGLGLATVAGIVKQSQGFISAMSEPGKGSAFRVLLPCTGDAVAPVVMKPRVVPPGPTRNTVLLAEDDGALRDLIAEMLTRNGYRVLAAATPTAAQRIAREFAGSIDLLLSDVILPSMKGPILAEAVARFRPEIRVLYMSGYSDADPGTRQYLPPNAPFLRKPFTTEGLLLAVSEAIAPSVPEPVH